MELNVLLIQCGFGTKIVYCLTTFHCDSHTLNAGKTSRKVGCRFAVANFIESSIVEVQGTQCTLV